MTLYKLSSHLRSPHESQRLAATLLALVSALGLACSGTDASQLTGDFEAVPPEAAPPEAGDAPEFTLPASAEHCRIQEWTRQFGTSSDETVNSLSVGSDGSVLVLSVRSYFVRRLWQRDRGRQHQRYVVRAAQPRGR